MRSLPSIEPKSNIAEDRLLLLLLLLQNEKRRIWRRGPDWEVNE